MMSLRLLSLAVSAGLTLMATSVQAQGQGRVVDLGKREFEKAVLAATAWMPAARAWSPRGLRKAHQI